MLYHLRSHPPVGPRLRCHVALVVNHTRDAEVRHLDDVVLVEQQVGRLQVPMHDAHLVEVVHAARHVQPHLDHHPRAEPLAPKPLRVLLEVLVQAALLHELRHDAHLARGGNGAHPEELHHVLVAYLPQNRHLLSELVLEVALHVVHAQHLDSHHLAAVVPAMHVPEGAAGNLGPELQLTRVQVPVVKVGFGGAAARAAPVRRARPVPRPQGRRTTARGPALRLQRNLSLHRVAQHLLHDFVRHSGHLVRDENVQQELVRSGEDVRLPHVEADVAHGGAERGEPVGQVPAGNGDLVKHLQGLLPAVVPVQAAVHGLVAVAPRDAVPRCRLGHAAAVLVQKHEVGRRPERRRRVHAVVAARQAAVRGRRVLGRLLRHHLLHRADMNQRGVVIRGLSGV
mmetsp:Transcript_1793/g.3740  ORF Transcript_1793/g.3740 Transcript_1793/m.3740 type:complete len:397 (+) Transcript_1793:705-1895(+)